ncbi:hypothetical protein [Roseibium sp.]|uniref:hypothetical protein n=1 Tax=Roseibium sp. TaxID=1936156 RepID=UPI003A972F32
MTIRTSLCLGIALAFLQGLPAAAQTSGKQLDDFANGLDDFAPSEAERPLDELVEKLPQPEDAVETLEATTADAQTAEPAKPVVPEGWQVFEGGVFAVSLPPDWKVVHEDDGAVILATDIEQAKKGGLMVVLHQLDDREFARDFSGERIGFKSRSGIVDSIESLDVGGEIHFNQYRVHVDDKRTKGEGYFVVSPWPNAEEEHSVFSIVAMNVDPEPHRAQMDQIRKTVRLANPGAFRAEVIAPHEAKMAAEAAPKGGLAGLVTFTVPQGWKVVSNSDTYVSFTTTPEYSAYLTIGTGERGKLPNGVEPEFAGPPAEERATILGETARVYAGMTRDQEIMEGMSMVSGVKKLFILDRCLPDLGEIHVTQVGAPRWMESKGFEDLLSAISLTLPEGTHDCAKAGPAAAAGSGSGNQVASSAPSSPDKMDVVWQTYANGRFGTVVDYPAGYLVMQPAPTNDDGRTFESIDGKARVLVYGSHNFDDSTLPALMARQIAEGGYQALTSSVMQGDRFEVGGTRDGRSVVHVEILDEQNIVHTLDIAHDADLSEKLVSDLSEMAITFRAEHPDMSPASNVPSQPQQPAADQSAMELAFWQAIAASEDPADFEAYLSQWPNGTFAALARNKLNRLAQAAPTPVSPAPIPDAPSPTISSGPASGGWAEPSAPTRTAGANPGRTYTPKRGSPERKALMDAARVPISNELGQKVIFVVSVLHTDGNWAYLQGTPVQPNGAPLNWLRTPFARDWKADAMSDVVMVLMRKSGGRWQVMDYVIGPTDVHWYGWLDVYGLPEAFFMP